MQDLQIDSRVSRTQYQYTLEDADADELADVGAARCSSALRDAARARRRRERSAGRRACSCRSTIDRDTASRLGVTPQAIDDTLYDAFGQRQVSTIFTQLNQYRVILEVAARATSRTRRRSTQIYVRTHDAARRCRCRRFAHDERRHGAARRSRTRGSSRR